MTDLQYLLLSDSVYLELDYRQYPELSDAVHNSTYPKKDRINRIENFKEKLDNIQIVATRKLSNGLYCMAVQYDTELVFAYRGTEPKTWQDMTTNIDLWAGPNVPSQFINAVEFYNDICSDDKYSSLKVSITGHSLGGGLAQYVSVMGDKAPSKVVGFNSIGISDLLTQTKILSYSESDKKIGEILISNNLNDFKTSNKLIDGLFGINWILKTGESVSATGVIDNPSKMIECLNNYKKSCDSKYYSTIDDAVSKVNSRLKNMDNLTYHYTNFDDLIGNASMAESLIDFVNLKPEQFQVIGDKKYMGGISGAPINDGYPSIESHGMEGFYSYINNGSFGTAAINKDYVFQGLYYVIRKSLLPDDADLGYVSDKTLKLNKVILNYFSGANLTAGNAIEIVKNYKKDLPFRYQILNYLGSFDKSYKLNGELAKACKDDNVYDNIFPLKDWEKSLVFNDDNDSNGSYSSDKNFFVLGNGNNIIYGTSSANYVFTGSGQDVVYGGNGDDYIDVGDVTGSGVDMIFAGDGNDTLIASNNALLSGGIGFDTYSLKTGKIIDTDGIGTIEGISGTYKETAFKSGIFKNGSLTYKDGRVTGGEYNVEVAANQLGIKLVPTEETPPRIDPLVLDLDGDGLETTTLSNGVNFDFNMDGMKEKSAWIGKDDGFLVSR